MSKNDGRRRVPASARRNYAALARALNAIVTHPARSLGLACFSSFLVWLVLTKSLPYVLAPTAPNTALKLNSNNPEALLAKAELARAKLLSLMSVEQSQTQARPSGAGAAENSGGTNAGLPSAAPQTGAIPEPEGGRQALRDEIRALAVRTIENDPLNARAYRLLAEVTDDPGKARWLMQEAVKRSRRESFAIFWLLNDSYYHKDFKAALGFADVLLRTRPELSGTVFKYFAAISQDLDGRNILVHQLGANPPWRRALLAALPALTANGGAVIEIAAALKESAMPLTGTDLAPLLTYLVSAGRTGEAYNAWLLSLPQDRLNAIGILTNPDFETAPDGSPFDWRIDPGTNAFAEIGLANRLGNGPENGLPGRRLLHIKFNSGRVRFPEVSQVVVLSPGRYRVQGAMRGTIGAKRGLRWEMRCASGDRAVLGETPMLLGQPGNWQEFSLEASIPPGNCPGQELRLYHDSRSASEEFISGEVWFSGLRLDRVRDTAQK